MVGSGEIRDPGVIIIGAGFGGFSAAKSLARGPFDITLIDRYNCHLFQPLLYQFATAALSPSDIASPIRAEFYRRPNPNVMLSSVTAIAADHRNWRRADEGPEADPASGLTAGPGVKSRDLH